MKGFALVVYQLTPSNFLPDLPYINATGLEEGQWIEEVVVMIKTLIFITVLSGNNFTFL